MARPRRKPRWLTRVAVDAIHADQIREHGGLPGIRDEHALEAALARPLQKWRYAPESDLAALAAAYGFGLCRNHPYRDGNKRIGFLAMVTFLGINGYVLDVTDEEIVVQVLALAAGERREDDLATWLRRSLTPTRRAGKAQTGSTR